MQHCPSFPQLQEPTLWTDGQFTTPSSCSTVLLSSISFPSLSIHAGLLHAKVQHLSLLNFIWLSWSLCRASALEGIYSSSHFSSQQTYLVLLPVLTYYSFQSCVQVIHEDVEENGAEDGALQSPISGRTH